MSWGFLYGKKVSTTWSYKTKQWTNKRKQILKRDGYLCQECKRYGRRIDAVTVHHKKHVDEYPELAYKDDNLVSLCDKCHNVMHPEKGGRRFKS